MSIQTAIPKREDLPLILAWIRRYDDLALRCEGRPNCQRLASFAIAGYEDTALIQAELQSGKPQEQVIDTVWRNTMHEQMLGHYTVHETLHWCMDCQMYYLMHFLNTAKDKELRVTLEGVRDGKYSLIQWHKLSNPDLGLCAVVPLHITTPEAFLTWLKRGVEFEYKLQE